MRWRLRGWNWPKDDDNAELDRLLAETWQAAAAATGGLLDIQAGKAALLAAAAQQAARPSGNPALSVSSAAGQTARPTDPRPGRRRLAARATAVAGAAGVAAALLAVLLPGSPGSRAGREEQVQADAFVARVQHALASQAVGGLVSYARSVVAPGTLVEPEPDSWKVLPGSGRSPGPGLAAAETVSWTYQSESVMTAVDAAGRPLAAEENAAGRHGITTVAVDYRDRTWWRVTLAWPRGARTRVQPRCAPAGVLPTRDWRVDIRLELSCGAYTEDGRQRVDGIDAIKLTGSNGVVLWIDPSTYLPVRLAVPGAGAGHVTDFRWYRATPASLAKLKVTVPAGFRRVAAPRP
jgi:hypothetical protein